MSRTPSSIARPQQVTTWGNVRVTVLTDRLLRVEYAEDQDFEDRSTLAVQNRRFPSARFEVLTEGDALTVDTGAVRLHCSDVHRPFSPDRLHARLAVGTTATSWRFGQRDEGNLGGTVRTLDGWKGSTVARLVGFDEEAGLIHEWDEQQLEPGLLSRDGWVVVDDSDTVVLDAVAGPGTRSRRWPVPRPPGERRDLYLFAYGDDHRGALAAGAQLFGAQPLPPRFAFGYWYSRYYAYTDRELRQIVDQLDRHDVPADVLVIDMDWHRPGWTGYSWDRDLFPDPTGTLEHLHDRGLRVALNLHPADGVAPHEDAFRAMCDAMGLDPAVTDRVPFDVTDPRFVDVYFRLLHHPEEDRGVDFWWMDWQQGTGSPIAGLDPLAWLNHLHWDDQERRRPNRRPLIFSRWGGPGAGRYPIGFSGDTHAVWESLAYQPEFTATAANVLYGYWSHDIGGHFGSTPDPELYTRWIQFGVHSPVLRTHGTLGPEQERRIWEYPSPYRAAMIDAVRHRYELVPYVYGECRRGVDTGRSLLRPMYHEHAGVEAAHEATGQYLFGDRMVVAPVVQPRDDDAMAAVRVWLPQGDWFDLAQGVALHVDDADGAWFERRYLLDEVPVFVPAGSVIPGQRDVRRLDTASYPNLVVTAYPGPAGRYDLYEDDGVSTGYLRDRSVSVPLQHRSTARRRTVRIGEAVGAYRGWLRRRPVEVRFVGEAPPRSVRVDDAEVPWAAAATDGHWHYDAANATVVVSIPRVDLRAGASVTLERVAPRHRAQAEALLDGYPGLARRLDVISESTRTLVQDDNRRIVALSLTVDRIERDPSALTAELTQLRLRVDELDELLERHVATWLGFEALNP
ncbi:MAG: glycoside hydrolase family 31 protein, partial [Microthrixaceae bacterium]